MTPEHKARVREAKARLASHPRVQAAKRRQRLRQLVGVVVVLLLLLFLRCDGCEPGLLEAGIGWVRIDEPPGAPSSPTAKRPAAKVSGQKLGRPTLDLPPRPPPAWLEELLVQVAARSPRLSACFVGTARPGAIKWTAALAPQTGATGEHAFEPLGTQDALSTEQTQCLIAVLSKPAFAPQTELGSLPLRVSVVLEF